MTTGPGAGVRARAAHAQPRDHVHALAQQRIELGQLEMRGHSDDAASRDLRDVVQRALADEEAVDRVVGESRMHPEDVRQVACGSRSMRQRLLACAAPMAARRLSAVVRLADAALLAEDRDNRHGAQDTPRREPRLLK